MKLKLNKNPGSGKIGFTFVEVMITFSLFMLLASVGIGAYFRYYHFSLINEDVNKVTKILYDARFRAMKNSAHSDYGVHLETASGEITIFRDAYTPGNSENIVTELKQLNFADLNLLPSPGVTNNIVFDNVTGKTQNSGSFTVSKDDFSFTYQINGQGAFE